MVQCRASPQLSLWSLGFRFVVGLGLRRIGRGGFPILIFGIAQILSLHAGGFEQPVPLINHR